MQLFVNYWSTALLVAASAEAEQLAVPAVEAAKLEGLDVVGDFYLLTLFERDPLTGQEIRREIVRVSGRSGGVLDVARAQEGTLAQVWDAGSLIECRVTKGTLDALRDSGGMQAAFPTADAGDYADVDAGTGSATVRYLWDVSDTEWVASGSGTPLTAADIKVLYESNPDTNAFSDAEKAKLAGVAAGATYNPTTDSLPEGASNLWFTVARVLAATLTGLSVATGGAVVSTDSVLAAFGKLQKQINDLTTALAGKQATLVSGTNIKTINGSSLLGSGDLVISGGGSSNATQTVSSSGGVLDLSATTAPVILVPLTENIASVILPAGAANQSIERRIVFTQGGAGTYTIPSTTGSWGSIAVDGGGVIPPMGTGVGTVGVYVLANDNNGIWRLYLDDSRRTSPYATASGTANAISLSINHVPSRLTAYAQGDKVRARIGTTNTGATTLAVDGLSAVNVVTVTGAALPAGYIRTDVDTEFTYNGSAWIADRVPEFGSNANGRFWRYADGSLRCENAAIGTLDVNTAAGAIYISSTTLSWVFPATFLSGSTPILSGCVVNAGGRWLGFTAQSNTGTDIRANSGVQSATTQSISAEANGRWY